MPIKHSPHPHADRAKELTGRAQAAYRDYVVAVQFDNEHAAACALNHFNALWNAAHEFLCASIAAGEWKGVRRA